jgi:PAS domain S-box-containing protein
MQSPARPQTLSAAEETLPSTPSVAEEVREEQARLAFGLVPMELTGSVLFAALVLSLSWQRIAHEVSLAWFCLVILVAAVRLLVWTVLWRREPKAGITGARLGWLRIGAALTGGLCGLAPLLLSPGAGLEPLLLIVMLVGILATGSIVTLGSTYDAYLSYLLPLALPTTARLLFEPHPAALSVALVSVVFVGLLAAAARQVSLRLQESLELRFGNAALSRRLHQRAADLEAEMAHRHALEKAQAAYAERVVRTNEALQREVAERTRSEEAVTRQALAILESEVRLRAIFNNAFDGILTLDSGGRIQAANPAAEQLFGARADDLKRRAIHELIPEIRYKDAAPSLVCELAGRRSDGSGFPVSLSLERTETGLEAMYVCLVRDNTAAQTARRALEEAKDAAEGANKAKSEFLSSMSHELRTPMNAILGFAQLLQTDPEQPLSATQKESVDQIARAGWHLLQLINDVLDLAKIEAGRIEAILDDVTLDDVMGECLSLVAPLADKHGIELVDQASASGLHVRADYTRLKQVVLNLLSNAIKYNRPNGSVALEVGTADGLCEIAVVDTGVGLTAEQISRIFEPFTRVAVHRDEIEGTGIGLTITRKLVALMGGEIGVSSAPDEGSRFWVRLPPSSAEPVPAALPAAMTGAAAAESATQGRRRGPGQTVLYVEDNPANLALVEYVLRQRRPQLRLLSAHTGELGLSIAEAERPDLIILDISLPGMDGYEVLSTLRDRPEMRGTPIFALSANAMQTDINRGLAAGFDDYLTKPIDVSRLLRTIDDLLERRAAA